MNAEGKTVSVGSYMIPLLQENCEKAGVKMMLDTTATEILTDANGAAVGVKATGASGETVTVNAKAVVRGVPAASAQTSTWSSSTSPS